MTSSQTLTPNRVGHQHALVFAGDNVRLVGQVDYPDAPPPKNGFPLVFILHHAGCQTLKDYQHFADLALTSGFAVFRWDKRGTGGSGASGRGSTTQDAINAYATALKQANIDRNHAVILAQGAGSGLLGNAFERFDAVQHPCGAILVANLLDEEQILAVKTRVQIVLGQQDWHPWEIYGRAASQAHNAQYDYNATFYVAPEADRSLMDERSGQPTLHAGAREVMSDWLQVLCQISALA